MAEEITHQKITIEDDLLLRNLRAFKKEAKSAKESRRLKDRDNMSVYLGDHDFSHKIKGQSRVVLAKQPIAIEQIAAFVKRSLMKFGDWFTVSLEGNPEFPVDEKSIFKFLTLLLDGDHANFGTGLADGIKQALNKSLMIFKVHGQYITIPHFRAVRDTSLKAITKFVTSGERTKKLLRDDKQSWKLLIELIPTEDYNPDPTGAKLYEIHSVEKDLANVLEMAAAPNSGFNKEAIEMLKSEYHLSEEDRQRIAYDANQNPEDIPKFRRKVQLDEFWGSLFDDDGLPIASNIQFIVANDKHVLLSPRPNPFWHGQSPFVAVPLMRVPGSVWHKALMDHASSIAIDRNELFSMMVDGGKAAVWGIRTVKPDNLEDPTEIQAGIPYGATLKIRQNTIGNDTFNIVKGGDIPNDALNIFHQLTREHEEATLINSIAIGQLPPRQVKATEVVQAQQGQNSFFESIANDVERDGIEQVLKKAWMTALQFVDDYLEPELVNSLGDDVAVTLQKMAPEDRFAAIALGPRFKVRGLSSIIQRIQDYNKLISFATFIFSNDVLARVFMEKYDTGKFVIKLLKGLEIDPAELELRPEEQEVMRQSMLEGMAGSATTAQGSPPNAGEALPGVGMSQLDLPEDQFAPKTIQ